MVLLIPVVMGLILLWVSGTTTLSRTSRAAAYVTLSDLIDGKLAKRES
jgi:hypothetical protein